MEVVTVTDLLLLATTCMSSSSSAAGVPGAVELMRDLSGVSPVYEDAPASSTCVSPMLASPPVVRLGPATGAGEADPEGPASDEAAPSSSLIRLENPFLTLLDLIPRSRKKLHRRKCRD